MFRLVVGDFDIKSSTYDLLCVAPNGFAIKTQVGLTESLRETIEKCNFLNAQMAIYIAQNFVAGRINVEAKEQTKATESNILEGESVKEGVQVGLGAPSESPIEEIKG